MKNLIHRMFLVVLCIAVGIVAAAQSESIDPLAEKARQAADYIISSGKITSVQYAIIDRDEIVLSGASGVFDKAEKRAVTKEDMYGIGSVSRMYVTACAMMLWDQGQLDLDKSLTMYIPEFTMMDERYKDITPRMLMNYSSGLFSVSPGNIFLFDDVDPVMHDAFLSLLAGQRLKADPGQFSVYGNDGFTLLEILVERISGMRYKDFLAERLIDPLGLQNTKTPQDDFNKDMNLVKAYVPQYPGPLPADTVNALGAVGLYSTAEDLCQFASVLMGKQPDLLSEQAALLTQNEEYKRGMWVEAEDGNYMGEYGLGWDTVHCFPFGDYGIQALAKSGDTIPFHSSLIAIPKLDIAMAVLSSGGNSVINYAFATKILQIYLLERGIIQEIAPPRTSSMPVKVEMPKELETYSGLYVNGSTWAKVEVKEGVLTLTQPGKAAERMFYTGSQGFLSENGSISRSFSHQTDGELYLQIRQLVSLPKLGQATMTELEFQRVEPASLEGAVLEAWKPRADKEYYLLSEKPSSQRYILELAGLAIKMNDDFSSGFACGGVKILDESHAFNTLKIGILPDFYLFFKDGIEFLKLNNGMTYIREDFIPKLTSSITSSVIGEDGFARYFTIGSDVQGKSLTVNMPNGAAYAVYDDDGQCVNFTTVSKNRTTILPSKGMIVLIGKAGDAFDINLQ